MAFEIIDTSGVLKNIDVASRFWAAKMDSSPDLHFDLKAVRMRARSDGTATIHFHFTLKGIFFVPEDLYQYVCHENGIDGTIGSSTVISSEGQCAGMTARALAEQHGLYPLGVLPRQTKASFLLMAEIDTAIFDRACDPDDYKWGACHGPLRPVLYDLDGIASMHLDASNMIHYMDFEGR